MPVTSLGSIFLADTFSINSEPDKAQCQYCYEPADHFILCRDSRGWPTAIYGDQVWDFNPYRLSAKKISRIRFDTVFDDADTGNQELIDECKYILYCLIYFSGGGRLGRLSAATLIQYWMILRLAIRFCKEQKKKKLVGKLTLKQLLTVPVYMAAFIMHRKVDGGFLSAIIKGLTKAGEGKLGYKVLNPNKFNLARPSTQQHPVIPTRIYLNLINCTGEMLDHIYQGVSSYEEFISSFYDECYGLQYSLQRSKGLGGKSNFRPDMPDAIREHDLGRVFIGHFACAHKRRLQRVFLRMQHIVKTIIHIYTGMRDQEVLRMPYSCISKKIVRKPVLDDQDIQRDAAHSITVISTTTKFSGYKKQTIWLASVEVVKAIEVAQAICRGLARLHQVDLIDELPLFLNPSILSKSRQKPEIAVASFLASEMKEVYAESIIIQVQDLQELAQSDPTRDFLNDNRFLVGMPWLLSSHQFRRSLAFYGCSSGFVSLPTLRTQFKHMTIEMAKYYSNNYENLRTIFGYYDDKSGDFILPGNHFAFEFQMAMPMSVANQLIADLLFKDEPLFGGVGSYMEKQKQAFKSGGVRIESLRAETQRRVSNGVLCYRPTLLGGCTKVGRCDSFLLGDYTACLSCEGAIIQTEKLEQGIEEASKELKFYSVGSGEYQIIEQDIKRLMSFKSKVLKKVKS